MRIVFRTFSTIKNFNPTPFVHKLPFGEWLKLNPHDFNEFKNSPLIVKTFNGDLEKIKKAFDSMIKSQYAEYLKDGDPSRMI